MSRIRSIYPTQWHDEMFCACSPLARLLALGLRNEADDNGVFPWKPFDLRLAILPTDNCDIDALLAELVAQRQVGTFTAEGRTFGMIRNFAQFQAPKYPSFRFPVPSGPMPDGYTLSREFRGPIAAKIPQGSALEADPPPVLPQSSQSPPGVFPIVDVEVEVNMNKPIPKELETRARKASVPTSIGSVIGGFTQGASGGRTSKPQARGPEALAAQIAGLTGEAHWQGWWVEVLTRLKDHPEGVRALLDAMQRVSDARDPATRKAKDVGELRQPGRFLVKQVTNWMRDHGLRWPGFPSRKGAA